MYDRIGIDTHGRDEPPDEPEPTMAELDRMEAIEQQIADLISDFRKICGLDPDIPGYTENNEVYRLRRVIDNLKKEN